MKDNESDEINKNFRDKSTWISFDGYNRHGKKRRKKTRTGYWIELYIYHTDDRIVYHTNDRMIHHTDDRIIHHVDDRIIHHTD